MLLGQSPRKNHLDLMPFNLRTEVELEEWFEDADFKIMANSATAATTLKVMQLLSEAPLRAVLNSCIPSLTDMAYIGDLADCASVKLFPGNGEIQRVEQQLLQQSHQRTVLEAFMRYRTLEECYTYMCARRERFNIGDRSSTNGNESIASRAAR